MKKETKIRRLNERDLNDRAWCVALSELFGHAFERQISPEYFYWRYAQSPKPSYFSVVDELSGLLASYSVAQCELIKNSKNHSSAISMTTMTHPWARGRAYFPTLAEDVYTQLVGVGVGLVWGFMNNLSHRIFIRDLGWSDVYEIPTLVLETKNCPTSLCDQEINVIEDNSFTLNYFDLQSKNSIHIVRTQAFLQWRYRDHPVNTYTNFVIESDGKASSYIVVKPYQNGIDLVDIQVSSPEDALTLLKFIIHKFVNLGYKKVSCWVNVHHFVHQILERIGFINNGPVTYFGGRELIEGHAPSNWLDFREWYLQMGDSDVY
jgi:hypothetical protein